MLNIKGNIVTTGAVFGLRRRLLILLMSAVFGILVPAVVFAGAFDDYFKAVKRDDADAVKSLLRRGLDPNLVDENRGDSGVILALREGSMTVFDTLLQASGTDLELKARNGDTALMIAAYKGNKPAVEALLARKVEVNRPGWTALHYAAASGSNDIVQLLLDRSAAIDARSPNKTTPLMMAAQGGHILTVKLLLEAGADAMLKNDANLTAIDFARNVDRQDIADGLAYRLKKAGKL
jgi:ankyrin repeat protein